MTRERNQVNPNQDLTLRTNVETYIAERREWIGDAVEICAPDHRRDHDPLKLFPKPTQPRGVAPDPGYTPGQEAGAREVAGRFGIGGETDVLANAACEFIEPGKIWKAEGEWAIVQATNHGVEYYVIAGSPERNDTDKLTPMGGDEIDYLQAKLPEGEVAARNEYDAMRQVAELQPGFVALEQPEILPYGYDIQNGHELIIEPTGQLVKIGEKDGAPVWHIRVDREDYYDEAKGEDKYRNRPDGAELVGFISDVLEAMGDETSSIGLNTSNTYASRALDVVRAGLSRSRTFLVGMYGRQTLADVRGIAVAEPTPINHIPGEMYVMQEKLLKLEAAKNEKWPPTEASS